MSKLKNTLISCCKVILVVILVFLIFLVLAILLPSYIDSLAGIFSWILSCFTIIVYLNFAQKFILKREIESIKKNMNKVPEINLFEWIGKEDSNEGSFYFWLDIPAEKDVYKNLSGIKNKIISKVGSNVYDYYLLKSFLDYHGKNNFFHGVWRFINPIFFALLSGVFIKLVAFDKVYLYFSGSSSLNIARNIELIIQWGSLGLIIFVIVLFIRSIITKEKRRIDLLISIIDIIIMEKKNE